MSVAHSLRRSVRIPRLHRTPALAVAPAMASVQPAPPAAAPAASEPQPKLQTKQPKQQPKDVKQAGNSAEETRRRAVERAQRRLRVQLAFVENARRRVAEETHPDMGARLGKLREERERLEARARLRSEQFAHGTAVIFAYECDEANSEFEMQCEKLRQEMLEEIHNEMEIIGDQRKGANPSGSVLRPWLWTAVDGSLTVLPQAERKISRNTRSTRTKNGGEHAAFEFDTAEKIKKRANGYVFQPLENKLAQSEVDHDLRELTANFEATKKQRVEAGAVSSIFKAPSLLSELVANELAMHRCSCAAAGKVLPVATTVPRLGIPGGRRGVRDELHGLERVRGCDLRHHTVRGRGALGEGQVLPPRHHGPPARPRGAVDARREPRTRRRLVRELVGRWPARRSPASPRSPILLSLSPARRLHFMSIHLSGQGRCKKPPAHNKSSLWCLSLCPKPPFTPWPRPPWRACRPGTWRRPLACAAPHPPYRRTCRARSAPRAWPTG